MFQPSQSTADSIAFPSEPVRDLLTLIFGTSWTDTCFVNPVYGSCEPEIKAVVSLMN